MCEYFILAILVYNAIVDSSIVFFYAFSDKFHQLYLIGRTGQLIDIGIDMIGVLIGVLVFYIYGLLVKDRILGKNS